jgi:hypothetical protein
MEFPLAMLEVSIVREKPSGPVESARNIRAFYHYTEATLTRGVVTERNRESRTPLDLDNEVNASALPAVFALAVANRVCVKQDRTVATVFADQQEVPAENAFLYVYTFYLAERS